MPAAPPSKIIKWVHTSRPKSKLRRVSFGATAAIVTSVGLIAGLNAASAARSSVVGSLLIVALADNLTDSLGVHVYQESERLAQRDALRTTLANFAARLLVSLSFVACALLLPSRVSTYVSVIWGLGLLSGLSYLLARTRGVSPIKEIFKHCAVALAVIVLSALVGIWVPAWIGIS
jgi:VIT1/CCC1 family predicted Fe2+/Mn2+ transporter